ncbi:hypothetical protein CK203_108439 [Vitis vinifera]|uniref:Uncharacterized protein n=1 Tax=Vitis vinifera TaxID=29760 RepID=A0A438D6V2_VITVI|nr:hypothetical protein CK203_108439 [Vitis vinifera]
MVLRSLQPRIARHVVGVPFANFGSLVLALYDVEDDISRGLWTDSSPSDIKGKKPFLDTGQWMPRAPRPAYDQTYTPQTLACLIMPPKALKDPRFPTRPQDSHAMLLNSLRELAVFTVRHVVEPGSSEAYRGRVVDYSPLLSRRLSRFRLRVRMDLHCAYDQGPGHETSMHCFEACSPGFDRPRDDQTQRPFMPDVIYEMSGMTLGPRMPAPFRLVPEAASVQATTVEPLILPHYSVQYIFRGGRLMRQPPPAAARPVEGTSAPDEVRAEDDEDLETTIEYSGSYFHLSLLVSSSNSP